jgi:hypothetical protein
MKSNLLAYTGTFLMICAVAWTATGQDLGTYTFDGADGDTNTPTATNLTFTPFSRVNIAAVSVSDLFLSDDWSTAGAQNTSEYVEFTVTPDSGYTLELTGLSFDVERSVNKRTAGEKDGPLQGQVQILQGAGLTLVGSQNFNPSGTPLNVTVNSFNFTTLDGETVTFRIYGWASGHKNGWLGLDNFTLEGVVMLAPEPSPATLMLVGVMLFVGRCALRRC